MSQNTFGKYFTELYAFLIETVQIPEEPLEHNLVFEMGQQSAEGLRGQLFADDDTGGTVAFEVFIPVFIFLSAGECHDLRCNIRTKLLLTGGTLNCHIRLRLILTETYKLKRNNICTLVQKLIE